jgi:ABC-2 type transport system ATP-binding protein
LSGGETTVFLSTHILPVVDELADSVGVLHRGRLVAEGDPDRLKHRAESGEEQSLEDVFLSVTADHAEEADTAIGEVLDEDRQETEPLDQSDSPR